MLQEILIVKSGGGEIDHFVPYYMKNNSMLSAIFMQHLILDLELQPEV